MFNGAILSPLRWAPGEPPAFVPVGRKIPRERTLYKEFPVIDGDRRYTDPPARGAEYGDRRYREGAATQSRDPNGYPGTRSDKATTEGELAEYSAQMPGRKEGPHMGPGDAARPGGARQPQGRPT